MLYIYNSICLDEIDTMAPMLLLNLKAELFFVLLFTQKQHFYIR